MAARQLRVEREHACDDRVLEVGAKPSEYAECLLQVARGATASHSGAIAALAMARRTQLADRLLALLDERRPRAAVSGRATARATLATLALAIPLGAAMPTLRVEDQS